MCNWDDIAADVFKRIYLLIYLEVSGTEREGEAEKGLLWFIPHVATNTMAEPGRSQKFHRIYHVSGRAIFCHFLKAFPGSWVKSEGAGT